MEGSKDCDAVESWLMHQVLMGVVREEQVLAQVHHLATTRQRNARCVHQWKMSCNAKAGSLGKMGASSGRQGLIDCTVEGCAPSHQIPYPGCLRCSTKAIQFVLLGESGVRSLPAVLRERDS